MIDDNYFLNYGEEGRDYNKVWRQYTGFDAFLPLRETILKDCSTILVLGSATGKILEALHDEAKLQPEGVELNEYASSQSVKYPTRKGDMRYVVSHMKNNGDKYDIVYSNSLGYLEKDDILTLLDNCRSICKFFYFCVPAKEIKFEDKYRKITESYFWWMEQFDLSGFKKRIEHQYLWEVA